VSEWFDDLCRQLPARVTAQAGSTLNPGGPGPRQYFAALRRTVLEDGEDIEALCRRRDVPPGRVGASDAKYTRGAWKSSGMPGLGPLADFSLDETTPNIGAEIPEV
jgi:hypothetical protein